MKGVLICGGSGTRLRPLSEVTHKSLIRVGDKPLIQYPLQVLLDAGIKEIMVITGPEFAGNFMQFLGSGSKWGCSFTYRIQDRPSGIAQALGMAESFADGDSVCALLGDNIFSDNLANVIQNFSGKGGHLFLKEVPDAERFGVAQLREDKVIWMEEKPQNPPTKLAVTGCYLYDETCFEIIRNLEPSARGEYEITDVSRHYMDRDELTATVLGGEWIDAGTHEAMKRADRFLLGLNGDGKECKGSQEHTNELQTRMEASMLSE